VSQVDGVVQGIAYEDPRLVIPFPQAEMDANNKMEQNEGY